MMDIKRILTLTPDAEKLVADVPTIAVPTAHLLLLKGILDVRTIRNMAAGVLADIQDETQRLIDEAAQAATADA